MRALAFEQHGDALDVLRMVQIADPPAPSGHEVRIQVQRRALHVGDLMVVQGFAGPRGVVAPPPAPMVPGSEGMGVVLEVGPDVDRSDLAVGSRVAFFPAWGSHAEIVTAPDDAVVALPPDLDDNTACHMLVDVLTSLMLWRVRDDAVGERPGVTVHTAASSSIGGLLSTPDLRRERVLVGVVRSRDAKDRYASRFPDVPVVTTSEEDWPDQILDAAQGLPVTAVLDAVGGPSAGPLLDLLSPGGFFLTYGDLAGGAMPIPAQTVLGRGLTLTSPSIMSWLSAPSERRASDVATVLSLAASRPDLFPVAAEYELEDFKAAVEHVRRPGRGGTVILCS